MLLNEPISTLATSSRERPVAGRKIKITVMTWMIVSKVVRPEELARPSPGSSFIEETNVSQGPQDVGYHQQAGRSRGAGAGTGAGREREEGKE